jgi:hypothetical protein
VKLQGRQSQSGWEKDKPANSPARQCVDADRQFFPEQSLEKNELHGRFFTWGVN